MIVLAMLPLLVALLMLAILQRSALHTGLATVAVTLLMVLLLPPFRLTPLRTLLAVGGGFATALTVLYVLFPALLLYQLLRATDSIIVLARGVERLCPDRELQILLLVIGVAPFVESVSGFGVGTVVIIPMLLALEIDVLPAAMLGLLGQIAVPWGALAVGTTLGAALTGLNANLLGASTALITALLPIGFGLFTLAFVGGRKTVTRLWLPALLAGLLLVAGEWFFSLTTSVELAGALAALPVIVVLALWGNLFTHKPTLEQRDTLERLPAEKAQSTLPSLQTAISPYALLTLLLLISRLLPPLRQLLQTIGVLTIPTIGLQLPLLYEPGFFILLSALAAIFILRIQASTVWLVIQRTVKQFTPGAVAIICFLATSQLMRDSGMVTLLGTSAATLGRFYGLLAPWLGALGGWLTGSNAGGNAMFAPLQRAVSIYAHLPLLWLMAAQNGSGSIATMVAPARTILATTTAGIPGKEGQLLRHIGPLVLLAIVSIMVLLLLFLNS